jgi:hypothetical protein
MLDWLFFDLSDLRPGELGRALKTLSHLEGLTLGSADCFTAMSDMCSPGVSSERVVAVDLLSMLRTWLKMGSRFCRVVCGPWSGTCSCMLLSCLVVCEFLLLLLFFLGGAFRWMARGGGVLLSESGMLGTVQGASSPMV